MTTTYTLLTCCHEGCGITFGVPSDWEASRREDHTWWYCPNGHRQYFAGKTEAEQLRDRLAAAERREQWQRECADQKAREAVSAEMARRATKGHLNRIKRRTAAGLCPCCRRSFQNLRRHMASRHADYAAMPKGGELGQ